MGGVVYMSRYEVVLKRIHNEGYLKGVKLQPEPVLGSKITRAPVSGILP